MPSRIDEAGHTEAFDYPVAEHWGPLKRTQCIGILQPNTTTSILVIMLPVSVSPGALFSQFLPVNHRPLLEAPRPLPKQQ